MQLSEIASDFSAPLSARIAKDLVSNYAQRQLFAEKGKLPVISQFLISKNHEENTCF